MSDPEDGRPHGPDKFTFLKQLTSTDKWHGKSFYQHLFNVYNYLKSQSLPAEVCDAGLFHSIYGTEFYHFQSDAITREAVRSYIGEYAEELVYIFCGLKKDRFRCIVNNTAGWDTQRHLDLCRIEHANFWDGKAIRNVERQLGVLRELIICLESEGLS